VIINARLTSLEAQAVIDYIRETLPDYQKERLDNCEDKAQAKAYRAQGRRLSWAVARLDQLLRDAKQRRKA
jgi:hypothetical protein